MRPKLASGFFGLCRCTVVQAHNTDVNDRRCAEGFERERGRCLGAVGSQSFSVCEVRSEHNGNRRGCGLLFNSSCVERILEKQSAKDNNDNYDTDSINLELTSYYNDQDTFHCYK